MGPRATAALTRAPDECEHGSIGSMAPATYRCRDTGRRVCAELLLATGKHPRRRRVDASQVRQRTRSGALQGLEGATTETGCTDGRGVGLPAASGCAHLTARGCLARVGVVSWARHRTARTAPAPGMVSGMLPAHGRGWNAYACAVDVGHCDGPLLCKARETVERVLPVMREQEFSKTGPGRRARPVRLLQCVPARCSSIRSGLVFVTYLRPRGAGAARAADSPSLSGDAGAGAHPLWALDRRTAWSRIRCVTLGADATNGYRQEHGEQPDAWQ